MTKNKPKLQFNDYPLDNRIKMALSKIGFKNPTYTQSRVIPLALSGKDILCKAKTGSGKTASFLLPLLNRILELKDVNSI